MNRIKSCKSYTKIVACFPIGGGYPEMAMDPIGVPGGAGCWMAWNDELWDVSPVVPTILEHA